MNTHSIPTLTLQAIQRAAATMAEFECQVLQPREQPANAVKSPRTPDEARAWLDYQGISVSQWARENHVHHSLVREVLAGRKKCLRGMSHNIAVLLGMKQGVLTTRPARVSPVRSSVTAQAGGAA